MTRAIRPRGVLAAGLLLGAAGLAHSVSAQTPTEPGPLPESPPELLAEPGPMPETPARSADEGPAPAAGESGGPVIVGEQRGRYKWWDLQRFSAALELTGQYSLNRQEIGSDTIRSEELILRPTLNIDFESYIGHKNLVDLVGSFKVGYDYDRFTTNEANGDQNASTFLGLFDVSALILQSGPAPLTVYARRDESLQNRDFNSTLRVTTEEYGAAVEYRSEVIPTRVNYFHRILTQDDPLNTSDLNTTQDSAGVQSLYRINEHNQLSLVYTFDHIDESQPAFDFKNVYDRHDGTLTHDYQFGEESEHNLHSTLRFYDQTGKFDQLTVRLDELLNLRHTDRLESQYTLSVQEQRSGGSEQQQVDGSAMVRHRLFESLVSTATVGGRGFQIPDEFTSTEAFVNANFEYTKKVPLGRLDASVTLGYRHQDNGERGQDLFIVDAGHVFNDPFDVVLSQRNIVTSSIVVTDVAHTLLFLGPDYTLRTLPDRVELVRNPFGSILNGQSVLVSYTIGPEPANSIDVISGGAQVRYTFTEGLAEGLSVYAQYFQLSQTVDAVDPSLFALEDLRMIRVGAEYRIGDFRFLSEWQNHDSNIQPYNQLRLEAAYDRRLSRDATISATLSRDEIDYYEDDDRLELNLLVARYVQRVGSGLEFSVYTQLRDQHDTRGGDVFGVEGVFDVRYRWRQTSVFASFKNSYLEGEDSSRVSHVFAFGFTRTF